MNKIKSLGLALLASAFALTSCSDYLEVQLDDQMSLDEVFNKRATTLSYLRHVYSYLPYEAEYIGPNGGAETARGGDGAVVSMSDDALFSWYQWVTYLNFRTGDWGPTTPDFNIWRTQYTGIEQASIFMDNVNKCPELSDEEKTQAIAEARFLRAYSYFQLFRRYGPVFIWGDQRSDITIKPEEIDRNTVDENVDFMISEIDKAIADLPLDLPDNTAYAGRLTKGAAMAAKARILLYAASPLFNGCDLYKGQMMNKEGKYLFPQSEDPQKWEKAAQAALDVINLNKYSLYEDNTETDPFQKAIKSYQGVQFKAWNSEIIWGYWPRYSPTYYNIPCFNRQRMLPPGVIKGTNGGYCASLKLVDAYPMAESGRYPVTGYTDDDKPIVDEQSGYVADGFTNDWLHPIEGKDFGAVKAHNSCIGRDARYYASIFANGFRYIHKTYQSRSNIVTFFRGGTSTYSTGDCVKSGFLFRRFVDPSNDYQNGNWGEYFWFYYRLAEIYLNYAEACNEKPNRNAAEALKYVNMIRARAGLNTLQEAYPEYNLMSDKEALRELIRKERQVEMAFEGHRYYDCRRWMIAEKEFTGKNVTLNLLATNYEMSWERTTRVWAGKDNIFEPKHYFFPINQLQLNEMKNITQNYGW